MLDVKAEVAAIKQLMLDKYISQDGLMRLDLQDTQPAFGGRSGETVHNANGILFLAIAYRLLAEHNALSVQDTRRALDAIIALEGSDRGLFNRHYGDLQLEAADNYAAIVYLSTVIPFSFAAEVCDYGWKHLYCYNNAQPGKWDWKAVRQPGDVCVYKIAAGRWPGLISMPWFIAGILVGLNQDHPGTMNLQWLRISAIENSLGKAPLYVKAIFIPFCKYWHYRVRKKYGTPFGFLKKYFYPNPDGPIYRLGALLEATRA